MEKSESKGFAYENNLARQILAAQRQGQKNKQESLKSELVSIMTRNSRSLHQMVPQKLFDEAYFNSYWAAAFNDGLADFGAKGTDAKAKITIRDCIWGKYVAPLSHGVSLDFVTSWERLPDDVQHSDAAEQVADIFCLAGELKRRRESAAADEKKINRTNLSKYEQKLLATAEACRHKLQNRKEHFTRLLAANPMLPLPDGQRPMLSAGEKENFLALYLRFSQIKQSFARGEEGDDTQRYPYDGMLFSTNFNKTKLIYSVDDKLPIYASRMQRPAYLGMPFYNIFFMFYRNDMKHRADKLPDAGDLDKKLIYEARSKKMHDYLMKIYYENKEKVDAYYADKRVVASKDISNQTRNLGTKKDTLILRLIDSWGVKDKYPSAQAQIEAIMESVDVSYSSLAQEKMAGYVLCLRSLEACREQFTSGEADYWAYRLSIDMYRDFAGQKQRGLGQYQSKWFKTRYKRIIDFYIANAAGADDREEIINRYLVSRGKDRVDSEAMKRKYFQVMSGNAQS